MREFMGLPARHRIRRHRLRHRHRRRIRQAMRVTDARNPSATMADKEIREMRTRFSMARSSHEPFRCTTGTHDFRPSLEGP